MAGYGWSYQSKCKGTVCYEVKPQIPQDEPINAEQPIGEEHQEDREFTMPLENQRRRKVTVRYKERPQIRQEKQEDEEIMSVQLLD